MSPINQKVACGFWCALVIGASGQNAALNSGDRLEGENAVRLREFEKNNNMGDPHRPMSPEMQVISRNPDLVDNLRVEDLAKLSLNDPLLKWAYACVFLNSMGPLEQLEPPLELVLADMRSRGEAVSPMFLKLIEENRETRIESSVLGKIEHLGNIRIQPFLEYARKLLRERTQSDVVAVASGLLARRGTKEDIELFEWVLTQQPFAITDLTESLKILKARLALQPETRPERREMSSSDATSDARSPKSQKYHLQNAGSATSGVKPWLYGGIILVMLIGVYSLIHKIRARQQID